MSEAIQTEGDPRIPAVQEVLAYAQGGDSLYYHWTRRLKYTESIEQLAKAGGCYWLIDLIASHQPSVLRKIAKAGDRDFQVWTLRFKDGTNSAIAACTDGHANGATYKVQNIEYSDFPLREGIKLYVEDGVLMVPSER
jgi:hypothetical protein